MGWWYESTEHGQMKFAVQAGVNANGAALEVQDRLGDERFSQGDEKEGGVSVLRRTCTDGR